MGPRRIAVLGAALVAPAAGCFADLGGFSNAPGDSGADGNAAVGDAGSSDAATPDDATSSPDTSADSGGNGDFTDDFARADGPDVGNGWIMKYAPAFHLSGGAVQRLFPDSSHDFDDNIVYRPSSEKVLDVEVVATLRIASAPAGYPQLHARVQDSVTTPSQLDSYLVFANASTTEIALARQHGGSSGYVILGTFAVAPALDTSSVYRLHLRVSGTTSVTLAGSVERLVSGAWQSIGSGTATDSAATRITTPGTVGFSGGRPESNGIYTYDDFTRKAL